MIKATIQVRNRNEKQLPDIFGTFGSEDSCRQWCESQSKIGYYTYSIGTYNLLGEDTGGSEFSSNRKELPTRTNSRKRRKKGS